jgi:hypothetical protein
MPAKAGIQKYLKILDSGNDPKRLEEMRAGIDKGFQMAAKALGGTLPSISMKTHEAVMDKLDAGAKGLAETRHDKH